MKQGRPVIVGAGLAGLTAAAYLARAGREPLILEKSPSCGGLVQSFQREGFGFDSGPRALGDAGILGPMLADLGIDLPLVKGLVSTGMGKDIVHHDDEGGVAEWLGSLRRLFPAQERVIKRIEGLVRASCRMARDLHRLPNPLFKNPLGDPRYLFTRFIPWLPSFLSVALRTGLDRRPIEAVLERLGADPALRDMVSQHFFKGTPWHFALGYFENFQDYRYPLGGTGALPRALEAYILAHGGEVRTNREVLSVKPSARNLLLSAGEGLSYGELLWAADLSSLYRRIDPEGLPQGIALAIAAEGARYAATPAGESVFTLFLAVDEAPEAFGRLSRGHFIHTPRTEGLGDLRWGRLEALKRALATDPTADLRTWVSDFCAYNSYEISIPALKDPSLAPEGKTALVVSLLCDGALWELADKAGRGAELKNLMTEGMLDALEKSVYPGLRSKLRFSVPATPLSLQRMFNSTGGAITGWSLGERPPVPSSLTAVFSAPRTRIPHVWKAGQWSYSPSGVPVAILTGRIAAGNMIRRLRPWAVRRTRSSLKGR